VASLSWEHLLQACVTQESEGDCAMNDALASLLSTRSISVLVLFLIVLYVALFSSSVLSLAYLTPIVTSLIGLPLLGILALPLSVVAIIFHKREVKERVRFNSYLAWGVVVMTVLQLASTIYNPIYSQSGIQPFVYTVATLGMFFVASSGLISVQSALRVYLSGATFISFWVLANNSYIESRTESVFGQTANGVGLMVAPAAVIVVQKLLSRNSVINVLLAVPMLVIFAIVLIRTQSQGAILSVTIGITAVLMLRGLNLKTVLVLISGYFVASLVASFVTRSSLELQSSREIRLLAAKSGLAVGRENFFLGVGSGQTAEYIYMLTGYFMSSHNQYIEFFSSSGIISALLFFIAMAYALYKCAKTKNQLLIGPVAAIAASSFSIVWINFPVVSFLYVMVLGLTFNTNLGKKPELTSNVDVFESVGMS